MRVLEIEIKNWSKFNPRSDAKSCAWFRMSNDFFNDPEFYGASLESRLLWMFLLCSSSKKMTSKIKINTQMIADNLAVRVESIDFALAALFQIGCITAPDAKVIPMICGPNVNEMLDDVTCPNVTNVTNERNVTNVTISRSEKNLPEKDSQGNLKPTPMRVIQILNTVCQKSFKVTAAHSKHINARIEEGFSLEDFASVVRFKCDQWANDRKFAAYLRPETLFGTKMDSYLQESKNVLKLKQAPKSNLTENDLERAKELGII